MKAKSASHVVAVGVIQRCLRKSKENGQDDHKKLAILVGTVMLNVTDELQPDESK